MLTEQQQEQAALFALGMLDEEEQERFSAEVHGSSELRELLISLQRTTDKLGLLVPPVTPPASLKEKILSRIQSLKHQAPSKVSEKSVLPITGLRFIAGEEKNWGWKQLPIPGASLKLLSFEPTRGYAVLLGKLEPGVRYPAHENAGPEDFYILTGDLHVGPKVLGPGDFHHADAGSKHGENFSVEGCTLLAVLTVDDPLVKFAMA